MENISNVKRKRRSIMNSKLFRNVIKVEFQVSNISLMMAVANTSYFI